MQKLIKGYQAASDLTGVKVRTLKNLVARKLIRVTSLVYHEIYFNEDHLREDLNLLERKKIE